MQFLTSKSMKTDGIILSKVFFNGTYSKEQQDSTLSNAIKIYERIPSKYNSIPSNTGLVVGRVQSGKTANVITLSALALDNGHKIIVLLLSDTNNLLTQNADRLASNFRDIEGVEVIKKSKDGDFDTVLDANTLEVLHEEDTKLIICSLKHSKHINDITNLISNSPYKDEYCLIIDDEGDDIGLNTASFDKKFVLNTDGKVVEDERTATNKAIVSLKTSMSRVGYISLTATPEANILLQDFQQLAPEFCVTLEPNTGYTGLQTFHGEGSEKVVEIKDYFSLLEDNGLPESFEDAFIFFVTGCIIRTEREGTAGRRFKHSMMVHPCNKIENHAVVYDKISKWVDTLKYNVTRMNQSGRMFVAAVESVYKGICPTNVFDSEKVVSTLNKTKLHQVNSLQACNDLNRAMKLMPFHVVIGGNMLDRGITIEGLAVTYMIRMARQGQTDTLLQRARWFGYKKSYIDLCRVYLPRELSSQFQKLIEIEESVWHFLQECDSKHLSPKDTLAYFDLPKGMRMTSSNKALYEAREFVSLVKVQNVIVHNKELNDRNLQLVKSIDWADAHIKQFSPSQKHRMKCMSVRDFWDFIKSYTFSDAEENIDLSYIKHLLTKIDSKSVDVWDMRYENGEGRSTDEYKIHALLQGYSEGKNRNDEDYYIGDRNIKSENLSIQIHHVKLKNNIEDQYKKGDEVIMLAFVMPEGYIGGHSAKKLTADEIKNRIVDI